MNLNSVVEAIVERFEGLRLKPRVCSKRRVGILVAIEGIDGSGLTTNSLVLQRVLSRLGLETLYVKEPTDSPIGSVIRAALRGQAPGLDDNDVLVHLFLADRIYHVYNAEVGGARGLIGLVSRGAAVVCDRYKYSSIVYQSREYGVTRGVYTMRDVMRLNAVVPPAHVLVYLDTDPRIALERLSTRSIREMPERLETLEKLRRGYRKLIELLREEPEWPTREDPWIKKLESRGLDPECLYPSRAPHVITVDANRSLREVANEVVERTIRLLLREDLVAEGS